MSEIVESLLKTKSSLNREAHGDDRSAAKRGPRVSHVSRHRRWGTTRAAIAASRNTGLNNLGMHYLREAPGKEPRIVVHRVARVQREDSCFKRAARLQTSGAARRASTFSSVAVARLADATGQRCMVPAPATPDRLGFLATLFEVEHEETLSALAVTLSVPARLGLTVAEATPRRSSSGTSRRLRPSSER